MNEALKLIRYNTGTDKKLFKEFADFFDAVIMNATIVAYSGAAMADLVSIYKDKYIIDPQTYILQQNYDTITSTTAKKRGIKKSIYQYLSLLPPVFLESITNQQEISPQVIEEHLADLVTSVGDFEINHIVSFIQEKEYNKYLDFISENEGDESLGKPSPKLLVAPYFMLKENYDAKELSFWMNMNKRALNLFVSSFADQNCPISGQLVMEKGILERIVTDDKLLPLILDSYKEIDFENIFVWIDDFSPIDANDKCNIAFSKLVRDLNAIGKKPIMAYGGYDSILLCHASSPAKLYGVAQSVGYGEKRQITPVGGGLPVNKYYFLPTHQRLKVEDVYSILSAKGYFDDSKSKKLRADEFYKLICSCQQCHEIIQDDIDNFFKYNDSNPFSMRNGIRRNRPTQEAIDISARHFLFCKKLEWMSLTTSDFNYLVEEYMNNIKSYGRYYDHNLFYRIHTWVTNYGK